MDYQDIQSYADLSKDEKPAYVEFTGARNGVSAYGFALGEKKDGDYRLNPLRLAFNGDGAGAKFLANVKSVTLAGGPIHSKHFQTGPQVDYNESHTFTSLRIDTHDYGRYAVFALTPNSENRNSFGVGYVFQPLRAEFGKVSVEASLMVGLVTGYQDYPLPMVGGNLRAQFYEKTFRDGKLSLGLETSVMPYVSQRFKGDKWQVGVVGTTPYLSARYTFGK